MLEERCPLPNEVKSELDKWLSTIHGTTCFNQVMRIYAPNCYGKCRGAVKTLARDLAEHFGGATIYKHGEGCWVDDNGKLECEPISIIEIGHECASPRDLRVVSRAITAYSQRANQKAISVKNGSFYIAKSPELLDRFLKESWKEDLPG
jgi:hypothetical protein